MNSLTTVPDTAFLLFSENRCECQNRSVPHRSLLRMFEGRLPMFEFSDVSDLSTESRVELFRPDIRRWSRADKNKLRRKEQTRYLRQVGDSQTVEHLDRISEPLFVPWCILCGRRFVKQDRAHVPIEQCRI